MQIRKQYSCAYQVLELTAEVENLMEATIKSKEFDDFAKTELKSMVDMIQEIQPTQQNTNNGGVVAVRSNGGETLSPAQKNTILKQFDRNKGLAKQLGIELNDKTDVEFLTKKQASDIINLMFDKKNSKSGF